MKATDLMIGDWVGVFDDKGIIKDCQQVDWIRTGEIGVRYQKVWAIGCIKPILLTPEILEKNEFQLILSSNGKNIYSHLIGTEEHSSFIFLLRDEEKWKLDINNYYFKRIGDLIDYNNTLYVHELQHVLRLCGLNEIADNFKV